MDTDLTPTARPVAAPYAARLAELEEMLETLARARSASVPSLRPSRFAGDPVALTQALHPTARRSARRSAARRPARDHRALPVRVVVFDGSSAR